MLDAEKKGNLKQNPVFWCFLASFLMSVIILVILSLESGLEDDTLYIFLEILRFSSWFLTLSSIFLFVIGIINLIRGLKLRASLQIIVFFLAAIYGILIIIYDLFMVIIAGRD